MNGRFLRWWDSRSVLFSRLCDEEFTNGEVVLAHAVVVLVVLACGLAEWMGGAPW